jgi:POT family proton-dependent oligopeptide transporter
MSTKTFFGHPIGLANLFSTEMWERFSYYGMRAILFFYLTIEYSRGGLGMDPQEAKILYGIFTSLVYVTPIFGGMLADKILGQRKAIFIGALMMALGQLSLAYSGFIGTDPALESSRIMMMHFGLATLIMGNGFFKPNISTMVGNLYDPKDETGRDSGFTIFYMGINLGAFIAPLVTGALGEKVGYHWGFLAAGIGMLIGTIWFFVQESSIGKIGLPPKRLEQNPEVYENNKISKSDWFHVLIWTLVTTALTGLILYILNVVPAEALSTAIKVLAVIAVVYLAYAVYTNTSGKTEWSRIGVIFMLAIFNIIFWSGFEQAGTTFNQFAMENTDRVIFGWEMPASWFQSVNAIMIFIFAPLFTILWATLSAKKINPRTPYKFAWGLTLLGLGFIIMSFASANAETSLVSPLWLVGVYLLHTWGELFISPVGLSMITKLSPAKITSLMMGLWMGSIAIGNYLAQAMDLLREDYNIDLPLAQFIAIFAFIGAIIAFAFGPAMNKMMKGIH